jgi:adenine-specific DNA-methyltransferase
VTGLKPDGESYGEPVAANVEFFRLTYLDPNLVRRGREFESIARLLWLEAGARGDLIDTVPDEGWVLTETYGVLFTVDALAPFVEAVAEAARSENPPSVAFIVTDSPTEYQTVVDRLPLGIETVRLYEDYLSSYTINIEKGSR